MLSTHEEPGAETEALIQVSEVRLEVPHPTRTSLRAHPLPGDPGLMPSPRCWVYGPRSPPGMHTATGQ